MKWRDCSCRNLSYGPIYRSRIQAGNSCNEWVDPMSSGRANILSQRMLIALGQRVMPASSRFETLPLFQQGRMLQKSRSYGQDPFDGWIFCLVANLFDRLSAEDLKRRLIFFKYLFVVIYCSRRRSGERILFFDLSEIGAYSKPYLTPPHLSLVYIYSRAIILKFAFEVIRKIKI